jgi:predicted DNA-binding transcriptional regulator AlpA
MPVEAERIVLTPEMRALHGGVSKVTLDRYEAAGVIPRRRQLSRGRIGWLLSEVNEKLRALPVGPLTAKTAAATQARRAARREARV